MANRPYSRYDTASPMAGHYQFDKVAIATVDLRRFELTSAVDFEFWLAWILRVYSRHVKGAATHRCRQRDGRAAILGR